MRSHTRLISATLVTFLSAGCNPDLTGDSWLDVLEGGAGGGLVDEIIDELGGEDAAAPATPQNDSCESPTHIDLAIGEHAFEHGSLTGACDDLTSFCDGAEPLPEVVYQLSLSATCSTTITVDGDTGFDGTISLRSDGCAVDQYCLDLPGTEERFEISLDSGTYWVVVSGHPSDEMDFTLSVQCDAPACGDGVPNPGEDCDDGNLDAGDGCDASCQFEPADPGVDTCEGALASPAIAVSMGEVVRVPGDSSMATTIGATDSGTGTCAPQPNGDWIFPAADHVYRVVASQSGTMSATIGLDGADVPFCGSDVTTEPAWPYPAGCFDRVLHVREAACDSVGAQVACADSLVWWAPEEVSFPVTAGESYFVFVDGYNFDEFGAGNYVLRLELQ